MTATRTTAQSAAQHTPGPWAVQDDNAGVYYVNPRIEAGEDINDPRHDSIIARCTGFGAFSGIEDAEVEANARLIAAAPELLEALREAVYLHGHEHAHADGRPIEIPGSTTGIEWYKQARAALAKAEGRDR